MASLKLEMYSPLPVYLDETAAGNSLAPRPASLDGKIVGLLPNFRPAAVHLLTAIGALISRRYQLKLLAMQDAVHDLPSKGKKNLDKMYERLDALVRRVDAVVVASAD